MQLVPSERCDEDRQHSATGEALSPGGGPTNDCGTPSSVMVAWDAHVSQPVSVGVLQAVVLLPKSARTFSSDALERILRHQLLHVTKRDWGFTLR
jgi:hypothetical protein